MLRKSLFLAIILIGCSQGKQSETVSDTLLVQEYPVEVPHEDTIAAIPPPLVPIDTTFEDYVVENNPETLQLDPTIVYVYKKSGVDLYEVNREFKIEKVIGHFDYKAKVRLLSPLNRETPLTVDGMKGYYALAQIEGGRMAYVFTGWLVSLPVPEEASDIVNYLLKTIHIEKALVNYDKSDSLRPLAAWRYSFEQKITMKHDRGYESDSYVIKIPGLSIQQAWLLGRYFMPGMDIYLPNMPTDSTLIRVNPKVLYRVQMKGGKVWNISHEDDSGCFSFDSFIDRGDGVEILTSIGC